MAGLLRQSMEFKPNHPSVIVLIKESLIKTSSYSTASRQGKYGKQQKQNPLLHLLLLNKTSTSCCIVVVGGSFKSSLHHPFFNLARKLKEVLLPTQIDNICQSSTERFPITTYLHKLSRVGGVRYLSQKNILSFTNQMTAIELEKERGLYISILDQF